MNDTYRVRADGKEYFLRVYRAGWRSRTDVQAEVDTLLHLARDGIRVSAPVPRRDGSFLNRLNAPEGGRWAVLFTAAPGSAPKLGPKESRTYGELCARTHESMDRVDAFAGRFELDFEHLLAEPRAQLARHFRTHRTDVEWIGTLGERCRAEIEELVPKTRPFYGGCHGDHHGGNVHADKDGALTLFDFDCGGLGWRAYDIGVFLWRMALQHGTSGAGRSRATRRWISFLEGYERVRTLTPEEKAAARLFVPVRHIWLMGLHTEGAARWGHAFVSGSYFSRNLRFLRQWAVRERLM